MPQIDFEFIARNKNLQAHFQPIVELDSGRITAIEARVRWSQDPHRQLTAGDVLHAAAEADAERALDFAVLERAASALTRLRDNMLSAVPVAVNISMATCTAEDFREKLEAFAAASGINPMRLRLEFPLAAFRTAPERMKKLVSQLGSSHFGIAVDHVDTADLASANLDGASVQTIKLEEKLVASAPDDGASADTVRSICLAAQKRGLQIAAEGLMRLEQLEFLRRAGCHEGQGPLISRPRALGELTFLLQKGRCW